MYETRVLSGMRPTGSLHLGHYHGVLKNWVRLQAEYTCLFFAADWHALTTGYENPGELQKNTWDMVIDWLAAGVDPGQSIMFIQSQVIEHAELHLLLSMMTPLGWLERVPTYKDQQEKLADRDLATYGFLGYPLLQSADILIYRARYVPVGEDQVPHVEFTRELARRFNHLYGREPGYEEKAKAAVKKMGTKKARLLNELRTKFLQEGDAQALSKAQALLDEQQNLPRGDRERLYGWLEGGGKKILVEPEVLLTEASKLQGLDGQKMSKSYGNTISLREDPESVAKKIRTMPTDPARVKRSDPGNPEKCPVWELHKVYSDEERKKWVWQGCTTAGIGCLECKQPVIEAIQADLAPVPRVRRDHAHEEPGARRRVPGDGGDADGDQVAPAAAAAACARAGGGGPARRAGAAAARVRENQEGRPRARRAAAGRPRRGRDLAVDRKGARRAAAAGRPAGSCRGMAQPAVPRAPVQAPPHFPRRAVGARAHERHPAPAARAPRPRVRRAVRAGPRGRGPGGHLPRAARAGARAADRDHAVRMLRPDLRKIGPCPTRLRRSASSRRCCSRRRSPSA